MTLNAARRFAIIASACMLTLGASACSTGSGDSEQSRPSPPPTAEVRMSGGYVMNEDGTLQKPEVDMPAPVLDPAALEYSPEGAELAARHFLALTEYAWATGDTSTMRAFFTDECTPCKSMADRVDELYASGGWMDGTKYVTKEIVRIEEISDRPATFGVQLIVSQGASTAYSDGTLHQRATKELDMALFIHWNDANWKVVDEDAKSIE
ncbi:DUF6318 family protein [Schaalia hyovaginalis]|uniref:DUF6318 domain-containing protein n=1 Tax=Schaalia hyovaginalis TaxID=29316 RepID=A0A923E2I3_9ACTO|nr:DUF6318 family protein [Schaalia hyovaginalis]MBB6334689.1 hypothetical protein [Schaalia hyovaginalis]